MTKYYMKQGARGVAMFNPDTEDFDVLNYMSTGIDWAYLIPADGEFTFSDKDNKTVTKTVKKYDIVLQLYRNEYNKHEFIIIRSKEWRENIKARDAYYEEKAAKQTANKCNDCDCECCDGCSNPTC